MVYGDELPPAGRGVGGCAATEMARGYRPLARRNQTRMRSSPSVGPAQVGQYLSAPRQSIRSGRRPTAGGAVQGRAEMIRGRRGKLEIANLPARTGTSKIIARGIRRRKLQEGARVHFV